MILELNGIYANLRFSSAHIVFGHDSCGAIHGHSYYVDLKVCGEPTGEFGFVCDFKLLKNAVKEICNELDHKLLVPLNHPNLKYNINDNNNNNNNNKNNKTVNFTYINNNKIKEYKLPLEDVVLLNLKSTTAEDLSIYFAEKIKNKLEKSNNIGNINYIEVTVNEGIGQGARYILKTK